MQWLGYALVDYRLRVCPTSSHVFRQLYLTWRAATYFINKPVYGATYIS